MLKANGLIYLNEDEWEDLKLREKYPDAMLAKTHCKYYGKGKRRTTKRFECSGMNRQERRRQGLRY